jgi:hypothetical protein
MGPDERREVKNYLSSVLSRDPHPHSYRRIRKSDENTSTIAVKRWRFLFNIDETTVHVIGVAHSSEKGGMA